MENKEAFNKFLGQVPGWYNHHKDSNLVFYSSCKVVRNLNDYLYPEKIEKSRLKSIINKVDYYLKEALENQDVIKIPLDTLTDNEATILYEKRIIPRLKLINRRYICLYISKDFKTFMLTNYENHLTIFSYGKGFTLQACSKRIKGFINFFPENIFQKDPNFNYLTNHLDYLGTGFKAYLYFSIPGIRIKKKLLKILKSLKNNGLIYTRFYDLGSVSKDVLVITHKDSYSLSINDSITKMKVLKKELEKIEKTLVFTAEDKDAFNLELKDCFEKKSISQSDLLSLYYNSVLLSEINIDNLKLSKMTKELKKALIQFLPGHLSMKKKKILTDKEIDCLRADFVNKISINSL